MRRRGEILLVSTYELGHQPLALASPLAWLRGEGYEAVAVDTSVEPLGDEAIERARLVAEATAERDRLAAAHGELAGMVATVSGHGYDDLSFLDPQGAPTSLRALRGDVLLVNFWATWCIPCRIEMPALSALQTAYEGRGAKVVTINLDVGTDGPQKAAAFLEEINTPNLPLYADPTLKSFEALRQRGAALGLPTTLLIGPDGCEWGVLQGPAEWNTPDGHRLVDAAIAIAGARG